MTAHFEEPVVSYMTRNPEVAHLDTPVDEIARVLDTRRISGLPIVDSRGALAGVISQTDLISLGVLQAGRRAKSPVAPLPHRRAHDVMTRDPLAVDSSTSLREAARLMIHHQIHRVFVTEADRLVGVLTAVDLTAAVRDAKMTAPLSSIMTAPIVSVEIHEPLSAAVTLLDTIRITGLIVTEDHVPVGMFTQHEALASRDLPRDTPLENVYDAAVICLPAELKLSRAAAHAAQLAVRRVVACRAREAVGIVTTTDFTRVAARV
jgi:CBS domain-containing protein